MDEAGAGWDAGEVRHPDDLLVCSGRLISRHYIGPVEPKQPLDMVAGLGSPDIRSLDK